MPLSADVVSFKIVELARIEKKESSPKRAIIDVNNGSRAGDDVVVGNVLLEIKKL